MLIGLSGYAGSGKDTAAAALAPYGFKRLAFADKLKDMAYHLNPSVGEGELLGDLVDCYGWDQAKSRSCVRAFLQDLGLTYRHAVGEDYWVRLALDGIDPACHYVVTDVRFANEASAIENYSLSSCVVRIERPGVEPINGHESETALTGYPFRASVLNDGTPRDLAVRIMGAVHAESC